MRTLLTLIAVCVMTVSSFAQSVNVPQSAVDHFSSELQSIPVHWMEHNNQFLGQFKNSGLPAGMRYELDGTFVRKETKLSVNALPQAILTYLDNNSSTANVVSVFKLESANTEFLINISGVDHLFDANGSLIGTMTSAPFFW